MTASNESLAHVSYPTAVLAKSSKLIPTMIVGYFIDKKSFLFKEWLSAAFITTGIIIFNLSRMNQDGEKGGDDSMYGLFLLVFSLAMDGFLSSGQNKLKREHDSNTTNNKNTQQQQQQQIHIRKPTALETMLWINAYALIFLLPLSIWSGQFSNGLQLLKLPHSPNSSISIRQTILMLNLTAASGQIFIFFTIQLFSPLMCTTITTTRKFLTILLSVWKYGHQFTVIQWVSIFMVFGGLYLGIVSKFVGGNKKKINKQYHNKEGKIE